MNELHSQSAPPELFHCCLNCTAGFTQYGSGQRACESNNKISTSYINRSANLAAKTRKLFTHIFQILLQHMLSLHQRAWQHPTSCQLSGMADRDKSTFSQTLSLFGKPSLMYTYSAKARMTRSISSLTP